MSAGGERADRKPENVVAIASSSAVGPALNAERNDAAFVDGDASRAVDPVGGSWVTCYGRYRPTSTPLRDVTRLGLMCGPMNGMKQVGETVTGVTDGATLFEHQFEARAGERFRLFAVGASEIADLGVEVRDRRGAPLASDHNGDRWPI